MNTSDISPIWPSFYGRAALGFVGELGRMALFCAAALWKMITPPFSLRRFLQQVLFIGAKSLSIVALTGLFTGMVLGIQLYHVLARFGSETVLGLAVALSLIRELGPVLTALMVTGRAGSSMAAELGIMRISEQIDALDTMSIDPVRYLVSPRLAAAIVCFPLLTAIFDVVGIIGGYLTGVVLLGTNAGTYLWRMQAGVVAKDVYGGFLKAVVFAVIVCIVCCYQGYMTHRNRDGFGARGVSNSTTTAVVMSSVLILVSDYVLTSILL